MGKHLPNIVNSITDCVEHIIVASLLHCSSIIGGVEVTHLAPLVQQPMYCTTSRECTGVSVIVVLNEAWPTVLGGS